MLDLVTAKDIDHLEGPSDARFEAWGASLYVALWAIPITLFLTEWSLAGPQFWRGLFLAATTGIGFGIFVSVLGHWSGQHRMPLDSRKQIYLILANQSPSVPAAPPDAVARALCAVLVSDGRSAGGFLYVCQSSLVFQPHQPEESWPWQRGREGLAPVVLSPAHSLTLDRLWLMPRPWWKQPFFRQRRSVIRCRSEGAGIVLAYPPADFFEPVLQGQIDDLRRRAAA